MYLDEIFDWFTEPVIDLQLMIIWSLSPFIDGYLQLGLEQSKWTERIEMSPRLLYAK